jgi:chromosome partitioning protein
MNNTIALINGKGGVGRTTTAFNLPYFLSTKYKCLVIDLDPEGNLTFISGKDRLTDNKDIFNNPVKLKDNLYLIPSGKWIEKFDRDAYDHGPNGLFLLKKEIAPLKKEYDFIFFDTASSTNQALYNAIIASNKLLFVCESSITSLEGIVRMYTDMVTMEDNFNIKIDVVGILLTMVKQNTNHDRDMIEAVKRSTVGNKLFNTVISNSIVVKESAKNNKFIAEYKQGSKVALEYEVFAKEFLKRSDI